MCGECAPGPCNSSYSFRPIFLKLCMCFKDGLKIRMVLFKNPEMIFGTFLHLGPCSCNFYSLRPILLKLYMCRCADGLKIRTRLF